MRHEHRNLEKQNQAANVFDKLWQALCPCRKRCCGGHADNQDFLANALAYRNCFHGMLNQSRLVALALASPSIPWSVKTGENQACIKQLRIFSGTGANSRRLAEKPCR
jgi:hypothetical protein